MANCQLKALWPRPEPLRRPGRRGHAYLPLTSAGRRRCRSSLFRRLDYYCETTLGPPAPNTGTTLFPWSHFQHAFFFRPPRPSIKTFRTRRNHLVFFARRRLLNIILAILRFERKMYRNTPRLSYRPLGRPGKKS